ncbi:CocE/NonD family hydrolase [Streptomyces rochei]|uniref:CocE/NonD family hydrolase n=1 Tax=Streptomyces rochei TaxID=1928 RepID=UPI0036BAB77A
MDWPRRDDVATVEDEPLTDGLVLAGPIEVTGTLRTDQLSADLHVRLLDMDPEGKAALVARGNVRLARAEGGTPFRVNLLHTAYRVTPGHRLMLHLASSDYPEFLFNTGDASDAWTAAKPPVSTTVLTLGGPAGLRLSLSVHPDQDA